MNSEPHQQSRPLYNSRLINTYLKLIRSRYPYVSITELLAYAGIEPYQVADQGHWFTQEQVDAFYEKLVQLSGIDNIAREAGQYSASPDAIGAMRQYLLSMFGPSNVFELVNQASSNFTRSSSYKSRSLATNKVEITVTPFPGINEKKFQCENRIGIFEAILCMFNYDVPTIEHPECLFNGDTCCRYVITWKNTAATRLIKFRSYSFILAALVFLGVVIVNPVTAMTTVLPGILLFGAALIIATKHYENKELRSQLDNLRDSSNKLLDQIKINYNNALMTNEIGNTLSKKIDIQDILDSTLRILQSRLDYDRGMLLLANHDDTRLVFHSGFGYSEEQINLLKKTQFHLDRPESKGVFIVCYKQQKPFLINEVSEIETSLSLRSLAFAKKMGTQSFICCPIVCDEQSIGVLAVDNVKTKRPLIQSDISLLMGLAPIIGISMRNASLIDMKEQQFSSLLQVLAASIDARDSLTAGHSEKVTEYAMGICDELNVPLDYREAVRVAALLHDYGKIAVPDAILKKEGKLTAEEYDVVKTHASKTKELLEQINFEGILRNVPQIAGSHHEKLDGTGYPQQLTARQIPLGSKIIAVADFFEAITAKRHYRDPMPLETAMNLLQAESGVHFEKKIVNAFIRYYEREGQQEDYRGLLTPRQSMRGV